MAQLWGGRFKNETDKEVYDFNASILFDKRLVFVDMAGSRVHVKMLAKQGIISESDKDAILKGLDSIEEDLKAGKIHVFDTNNFTVGGSKLDSYLADVDTDDNYTPDTEVIKDGYFHESEYRSAPYFDLRIDGITTLNEMY